jgi:hypothetical protein
MLEHFRAVLRFAVRRPALVFLACIGAFFVLAFSRGDGPEPAWVGPVVVSLAATGFLSVVQGLRVLWRQSRNKLLVLSSLFVLIAVLTLRSGGGWAAAALALSPLLLAAVLELAIGRLRAARGPLWLDGPAGASQAERPPSAERAGLWRRNRWGCLGVLAILALFAATFFWQLVLPGRHAAAARTRFQKGMSVAEIVSAAEMPYSCMVTAPADPPTRPAPPPYWLWSDRTGYSLRVGDSPSRMLTRDALLAELGGADLSAYREVSFTFYSRMVPLRVSFTVALDERGRLKEVGPSRSWD